MPGQNRRSHRNGYRPRWQSSRCTKRVRCPRPARWPYEALLRYQTERWSDPVRAEIRCPAAMQTEASARRQTTLAIGRGRACLPSGKKRRSTKTPAASKAQKSIRRGPRLQWPRSAITRKIHPNEPRSSSQTARRSQTCRPSFFRALTGYPPRCDTPCPSKGEERSHGRRDPQRHTGLPVRTHPHSEKPSAAQWRCSPRRCW